MSYRMRGGGVRDRPPSMWLSVGLFFTVTYYACSAGELVWCRPNLNVNLTRFIGLLVKRAIACRQAKTTRWRTKLIQSCLRGIKRLCLYYFTRQTNPAISRPITEKKYFLKSNVHFRFISSLTSSRHRFWTKYGYEEMHLVTGGIKLWHFAQWRQRFFRKVKGLKSSRWSLEVFKSGTARTLGLYAYVQIFKHSNWIVTWIHSLGNSIYCICNCYARIKFFLFKPIGLNKKLDACIAVTDTYIYS